jgi:hypothetical protein
MALGITIKSELELRCKSGETARTISARRDEYLQSELEKTSTLAVNFKADHPASSS